MTYQGRCPIYHVDLYRVQSERDLETVGVDEFLGERGITIVEWGERITFPLRNDIVVELEDAGGEMRRLRIIKGSSSGKKISRPASKDSVSSRNRRQRK